MPPKAKLPAPIDRPLSRAYLRQFKGWSTAYPPGASDPASMRLMENIIISREGAAALRPGLRKLTRIDAGDGQFVGSYETFYRNDGVAVHLAAMKTGGRVEFRVLVPKPDGTDWEIHPLNAPESGSFDLSAWAGVGGTPQFTTATTYVRFLQIDNKILALSNAGEPLITFYVGATKKVSRFTAVPDPVWNGGSRGYADLPAYSWGIGPRTYFPDHAVDYSSAEGLANPDPKANIYNYAWTYTFSNDLGETAPAEVAQYRLQRAWGSWLWNAINPQAIVTQTMSPSPDLVTDPKVTSDCLALILPNNPSSQFDAAKTAGATKINFYVMSWSDQSPVPVEMQLVGERTLTPTSDYMETAWFVMDPSTLGMGRAIPVPTAANIVNTNTTEPSRAGQGIVAADRLVLVYDPTKAAVIRWSTNAQGDYLNMASSRGGGYKTLTSGNMQVPACVKLWQNPQSADTLTILNMGTDAYSTAYYMAPATVTSQSDNTIIMGFEETTATPGTVSPYGCEVANNALFHPLDDQLMKSMASNYNITHKSATDQIANKWRALRNKKNIVSCFHDQRLYYLVDNPEGEELEPGCMGNELWVLDLAAETPMWSRWLVQGVSLRRTTVEGELMLALIHPDGVYAMDPRRSHDESGDPLSPNEAAIPWMFEMNTQGANRAHDAWAHLRQANVVFGNMSGQAIIGIRGLDQHGKRVQIEKVVHAVATGPTDMPWDTEDYFTIRRDMKDWFFYARSVPVEIDGGVKLYGGQLSLVQYRYTPVSVNVGYEYGSVETFEYGRSVAESFTQTTDNGIPQPYIDTRRP